MITADVKISHLNCDGSFDCQALTFKDYEQFQLTTYFPSYYCMPRHVCNMWCHWLDSLFIATPFQSHYTDYSN